MTPVRSTGFRVAALVCCGLLLISVFFIGVGDLGGFYGFVPVLIGILLTALAWVYPRLGGSLLVLVGLSIGGVIGFFMAAWADWESGGSGGESVIGFVLMGIVFTGWLFAIPGALFIAAGVRERRPSEVAAVTTTQQ